ncbi:MAG: hypothetical protein IJV01_04020 [Bacteroidales bacterium]|nr:hypothetical protein [Bacteroidales bacterium]
MRFSDELFAALGYAREEAMRTGSYSVGPDHLFLGLLRHGDNDAIRFLNESGVDLAACKRCLDAALFHEHSIPYAAEDQVLFSRDSANLLNLAGAEALKAGDKIARPLHLLLALSRSDRSLCARYLADCGIGPERIAAACPKVVSDSETLPPDSDTVSRLLSGLTLRTDTPS